MIGPRGYRFRGPFLPDFSNALAAASSLAVICRHVIVIVVVFVCIGLTLDSEEHREREERIRAYQRFPLFVSQQLVLDFFSLLPIDLNQLLLHPSVVIARGNEYSSLYKRI